MLGDGDDVVRYSKIVVGVISSVLRHPDAGFEQNVKCAD